ncbi:hypothetical protein GOODEAATRI_006336, partial [Goodea atripinnis]
GEQCNVVPDTIDDIVADIGQEEKEEGETQISGKITTLKIEQAFCFNPLCEGGAPAVAEHHPWFRVLSFSNTPINAPAVNRTDPKATGAIKRGAEAVSEGVLFENSSLNFEEADIQATVWNIHVSCGMGMRSRERYVKQYPEDGSLCQLQTEETEKCVVNDECCESAFSDAMPVSLLSHNCVVTEWGEWDPCSVTCGVGMRRRERMVKMPPIDGSMCKTEVAEVEKCMMPECREFTLILNIVLLVTTHVFL